MHKIASIDTLMYQFYDSIHTVRVFQENFKLSNWCRIFPINRIKVVVPKDGWAAPGSFNWTSSTQWTPGRWKIPSRKIAPPPQPSILRRNCMGCFIAWNSPEGLLRAKARITDMFLTDIKETYRMCINCMPCSQSPTICKVHQNTQRIIEP